MMNTNTTELVEKQGDDNNNNSSLTIIGGAKGHVIETITGPLLQLYKSPALRWKPIPQCTGRYTCRDHLIVSNKTPRQLLLHVGITPLYDELEFDLRGRHDKVLILPLDEKYCTGIITYVKKPANSNTDDFELDEGTTPLRYVHTLNTPSGFRRKLEALGFTVTNSNIAIAST